MVKYFDLHSHYVLLALFVVCLLNKAVSSAKKPYEKWCDRNCLDYPLKQICATNNVTFPRRCDMFQYSCHTHIEIEIAYKGACTVLTECQLQRIRRKQQQALAKKQQASNQDGTGGGGSAANIHMPQCYKKSGNFVAKQCTNGYCWCVQPTTGLFVPGTSDREEGFRHDCSSEVDEPQLSNSKAEIEDDNSCTGEEKRKFRKSIYHLITKVEFNSASSSSNSADDLKGVTSDFWGNALYPNPSSSTSTLSPIHMRFLELDANKDGILQKKELHEYRRYVKLMVPEKVCARTMQLHCDLDGSGHLEYSEWLVCVKPDEPSVLFETFDIEESDGFGGGGLAGGLSPSHGGVNFPDPYSDYYGELLRIDYDSIDNPKPMPINPNEDCFARRKSQMAMNVIPLPECESDGRFKSIQCSEVAFTKICWCVDENTGLALKRRGSGQIVKAKDPQSLNCNSVNKRYSPSSEECSGDLLNAFDTMFLKALETHLKSVKDAATSVVVAPANPSAASVHQQNKNETFWTESFNFFDKEPRDSYVIKSELEWAVRLAENTLKNGQVCAHTIVSRCDLSQDQKLSQYEWNACFNQGDPRLPIE